jgi:hypothetical protein
MRVIKNNGSLFRLNWSIDMKKMVCILLMMVCAGMAFAQAKAAAPATPAPAPAPAAAPEAAPEPRPKKHSISMDLFPMFKGFIAAENTDNYQTSYFCMAFAYEALIASHLSVGADMSLYFGKIDFDADIKDIDSSYFSLTGEFRIYPQSESFEKAFIGTTFGFNMFSVDGKSDAEHGGFFGLTTSLKAGYKMITSKGFYMEPSLSYVLSKSPGKGSSLATMFSSSMTMPTPLGWEGGFRLGWAF